MTAADRACLALCCLLIAAGAKAQLLTTDIVTPVTVPYTEELRPWTVYQPIVEPEESDEPMQVHLSIGGDNSISVMWATGPYIVGNGTLEPNELTESLVHYGTSQSNLALTANGTAATYDQIYPSNITLLNVTNALNYTSPVLHTVVLKNLTPNTTYYYSVGDGTVMSQTFSFRSLSAPGAQAYPQRIIFMADWGYSYNSSTTLQHAIASQEASPNPPVIFYCADFSYADGWLANGTESSTALKSATGYEGSPSSTWQPVWDSWMTMLEPLVSQVPFIGSTGNHEVEQQYDHHGNWSIFVSVQARWPVPAGSGSYFYHSSNVGPVHGIFLSPYVDYTPGSPQWQWLYNDLRTVNRTATPWVLVNFHNPWYTTDGSYKQYEQMRVSMEPLTYQYGVDAFFYGHVHAYERTAPLHNYLIDPCGAVHITIGDAGNSEGLSDLTGPTPYKDTEHMYEDLNGGCPNVTSISVPSWNTLAPGNTTDPFLWYKQVLTFQANGNSTGAPGQYPPGFCYAQQPLWSQYRESSFGHGILDVLNSTHALWQWNRNQDSTATVADTVYIVRNTTLCPNKLGAAAYASGMVNSAGLQTSAAVQNAGR